MFFHTLTAAAYTGPTVVSVHSALAAAEARDGAALHAASVTAFCKARLADVKCPREIFVVAALPRTPTGKVVKHALRAWDPHTPWPWTQGGDAGGGVPAPSAP